MLQLMTHKARVLDIPASRRREHIEVGRIVEVRLVGEGSGGGQIEARVQKRGWLAGLFGRRPWLPFGRIEPYAPRGLVACLARADRIRCRVVEVSPRHLWADPDQPEIYVSLWADLPEVLMPAPPELRHELPAAQLRRDRSTRQRVTAARRGAEPGTA